LSSETSVNFYQTSWRNIPEDSHLHNLGFEVLTPENTKMAVLWVVAPCSLVEVYQRFRGPCCQTTRRYNPEDSHHLHNLYLHFGRKALKGKHLLKDPDVDGRQTTIKLDLKEIEYDGLDWFLVAKFKDQR
jgi:hypothetical protein